jgi:hypothetical protein
MAERTEAEWAQWQRALNREAAELDQMTDAFARWAVAEKVPERFTEEQMTDLIKAFAAGVTYALDAQEKP